MGNPQSKAAENMTSKDVPPGICSPINLAIHVKLDPKCDYMS